MQKDTKYIKQIITRQSEPAANKLISKYYKEIYGYIYKQMLNKELALDITQEVFISMLQSLHSFDEKKASFRTWLYKLTTNRIVDFYRSKYYKQSTSIYIEDTDGIVSKKDFTVLLEYKQDIEEIVHIVNRLDTVTQQIFRLKFFGEYTFLEIANLLEIPQSTVKTKYYSMIKKIKKIKKKLKDEENEER
ncbi:RNA polymerase sigma factor [Virgibacillus sp. W0181]|uniref:RNA polymerase sigma factor n=1 Tax=Virgibacillus sp. W0181 TaxID=3391581 RepID=UPI003F489A35